MGVVYRAKQVSLNRPVALKMIKSGVLADDSELRRFQNEAEAVALLDYPGIVPVYEVGEHDGQRYFSMKLIEGGNLADLIGSFKEDLEVAVSILAETTDAVQHAHIRGVLHRDLKPANILIDSARHPHITDFGLAKRLEGNVEMTATGMVMGTPAYMSPEQAAGHHGAITTATDVYGLGAILYAVLTGKAPFDSDNVIEALDAVRTRLPVPPRKLNAKVHRDLELICLKCLEKNPIDRYPTAASLADDLRRFAAGEPVSVRAAGFVERSAKWARRKPTLAAAYSLGILAALLGGLGGLASWQWRDAERARDVAEVARSQAVQSRADAEVARGQAERLRVDSDRLRHIAELQRDWIERIEYGRTIEVARQEWSDNNVAATRELLEATKPNLRGWEWSYLDRLAHAYSVEIRGTGGSPSVFSPDGTRILVATATGDLAKVWNARTGEELFVLKGHTARLNSASFSPDGSRIVTSSFDLTAKVWDTTTGTHMLTLNGHRGGVRSASFSPDGRRIITASEDGTTRVWETATINREILAKRPTPPPSPPSITLASRLPAIMRGEDRPADFAERASFARLARQQQHYGAAARWWGELLDANPKLGDDTMGFREMAAYDTALAAAGRGKHDVAPDEATKATLRRQALAWLKSDLVVQAKTLKSDNAPFPDVVEALYHIKLAPQLAGIRDPEGLAQITEDERNSCEAFWAEVDQLLKREEWVSMLDLDNERSLISLHIRARALIASHPKEAEPYVRNAEAEPHLLNALELARKYFEKTDVRTRNLMALLVSNLIEQGKWAEAETVLRAAIALRKERAR